MSKVRLYHLANEWEVPSQAILEALLEGAPSVPVAGGERDACE